MHIVSRRRFAWRRISVLLTPSPSHNHNNNPNPNPNQVHEASTFMVVLTTQYLCSEKCMLGLCTAW